jgi:hypothetical protein
VTIAEIVQGRDVAAAFEGEASLDCWQGPTPAPTGAINS